MQKAHTSKRQKIREITQKYNDRIRAQEERRLEKESAETETNRNRSHTEDAQRRAYGVAKRGSLALFSLPNRRNPIDLIDLLECTLENPRILGASTTFSSEVL